MTRERSAEASRTSLHQYGISGVGVLETVNSPVFVSGVENVRRRRASDGQTRARFCATRLRRRPIEALVRAPLALSPILIC